MLRNIIMSSGTHSTFKRQLAIITMTSSFRQREPFEKSLQEP